MYIAKKFRIPEFLTYSKPILNITIPLGFLGNEMSMKLEVSLLQDTPGIGVIQEIRILSGNLVFLMFPENYT